MYKFLCRHCKIEIEYEKRGQAGAHVTHCDFNPNKGTSYELIRKLGAEFTLNRSKECQLEYYNSPKYCLECNKILDYTIRANNFCNHSCSAKFNNKKRPRKGSKRRCKPRPQKVNVKCLACDKEMLLSPCAAAKRKYCSGTCRNKINNALINGNRSKAEKLLEERLSLEFPEIEMKFNDRSILGGNKELDVYIPSLKFGIEWNGIYHYNNFRGEQFLLKTQNQDKLKQEECKKLGIKLYIVKDLKSNNKFINAEINKIIELITELK